MRWLAVIALAACGASVNQDRTTGPDGVIEGATPIALVDNVARAEGTISYPDGDRVDWYDIALPRPGGVDVDVTWTGKRAAVELWDDDYVRVAADHPGPAPQRHLRAEPIAKHAYVRIYAPGTADAGTYQLVVRYTPGPPPIDWMNIDVPDPPHFPVPDIEEPCANFDPKNPACRGMCNPDAPDDACRGCPSPPDVNHPGCQALMPCPNPPDRRVRACMRPRCEGSNCLDVEELLGRALKVDLQGSDVLVWISIGSDHGLTRTWHGALLVGDSDKPLPGGELVLVRIDKHVAVVKTTVTKAVVEANPRVRFSAH